MATAKYQGFFVSINSKSGIPDLIQQSIISDFKNYCIELDCVPEQTKNGKIHLHLMCHTIKAMQRSNFIRTVRTVVYKYIQQDHVDKGIDVKVIKDFQAVVDYMSKTSILSEQFPRLKQYVTENFEVAQEIIVANKEYKETKIKWAYDNEKTWHEELDWSLEPAELWTEYKSLMYKHHGRTAPSFYKLQCTFESICYNKGYITKKDLSVDIPVFLRKLIKKTE